MPKRAVLPDTIAPSWLVVQLLGTLFFAATLLTAREPDLRIWAAYIVSTACWLGFVVLASRRPRTAAALLAVAGTLPAALVGWAGTPPRSSCPSSRSVGSRPSPRSASRRSSASACSTSRSR
jgi:hypothetical protein